MSGTVFRLCPVGGYDIPALEIWLEKMAGKGLVFDCTAGPLTLFARQGARSPPLPSGARPQQDRPGGPGVD